MCTGLWHTAAVLAVSLSAAGPPTRAPGFPELPAALVAICLVLFVVAWLRGWRVSPWTAVAVTLGTRVLMVGLSYGHTPNDVATYFNNAGRLVTAGRDPLTQLPRFQWNFLPLMPYVFSAEQHLGLPWQVAGKIAPVLAEVAITLLLGRLALADDARQVPLLYALCPVPLLVTAVHGQVEPVALALGLAALLLARQRRLTASGVVAGLAVATKTWPVLLVLGVLRETPVRQWWRLVPGLAVTLLLLLLSVKWFLHDSVRRAVHVLANYRSLVGQWGWTGILRWYGKARPGYQGALIDHWQHVGTAVTAVAILLTIAVFWRSGAVALTAAVTLVFLVVTAGFGVQYLLWSTPFVLLLRRRTGLLFAILASLYTAYMYWVITARPSGGRELLAIQLWGSLPVIAAALVALPWYRRSRRTGEPAAAEEPEPALT